MRLVGLFVKCDCTGQSGEISPKEFQQFFGKGMRLSKIEFAPRAESGPIFDFYMGKNTPERKDYIMDSLVVPVEE